MPSNHFDQTETIVGGTDGTSIGNVGDALKVSANLTGNNSPDFEYQIALGNIAGYTPLKIFGNDPDVTTTEGTIWKVGGNMWWPSSASTLTVSSSSTNDTSAGTGARTIYIGGLDSNWEEIDETLTLNGTSSVTTANSYLRVNTFYVATAGSLNTNAGNIIIYQSGNAMRCMPAGEAFNCTAAFSVPANKYALFTDGFCVASASASNKEVEVHFTSRTNMGVRLHLFKIELPAASITYIPRVPILIDEKTDLEVRGVVTSSGTVGISTHFGLVLVDK